MCCVDSDYPCAAAQVEELVGQTTAVFDVLSEFFYHANFTVQNSALEVYVRRAYVAYEIQSIDVCKTELNDGTSVPVMTWRFRIPRRLTEDAEGVRVVVFMWSVYLCGWVCSCV